MTLMPFIISGMTAHEQDDYLAGILGTIVAIVLFSCIILATIKVLTSAGNSFLYNILGPSTYANIDLRPKKLEESKRKILEKYFHFYVKLPVKSKKRFESRLAKFICH